MELDNSMSQVAYNSQKAWKYRPSWEATSFMYKPALFGMTFNN